MFERWRIVALFMGVPPPFDFRKWARVQSLTSKVIVFFKLFSVCF